MINFAFLDSGTGGLPYLKFLLQKAPSENCVYVADTLNFPYGLKTDEQIKKNASGCVKKIINKWNPKTIILACNTISVTALDFLRKEFPDYNFVGTVPAIKPAARISKSKKIGLLATNATVNHPYTKKLISDFANDCKIYSLAEPELIDFIEHEFFHASEQKRLEKVQKSVNYFKNLGCDAIVLACTHFLNMVDYFKIACGNEISVVDSREGVVKHALEVDNSSKIESNLSESGKSELYVTDFSKKNNNDFYATFCSQNKIKFGGILN